MCISRTDGTICAIGHVYLRDRRYRMCWRPCVSQGQRVTYVLAAMSISGTDGNICAIGHVYLRDRRHPMCYRSLCISGTDGTVCDGGHVYLRDRLASFKYSQISFTSLDWPPPPHCLVSVKKAKTACDCFTLEDGIDEQSETSVND
jgi:hypothetical protein